MAAVLPRRGRPGRGELPPLSGGDAPLGSQGALLQVALLFLPLAATQSLVADGDATRADGSGRSDEQDGLRHHRARKDDLQKQ